MSFPLCVFIRFANMTSAFSYGMIHSDGKINFSVCKQKINCVLIQQHVFKAIDESYAITYTTEKKKKINELVLSAITLHFLFLILLRKVGATDSTKELWDKLAELYTDIPFSSKLFLIFFRFKLDLIRDVEEILDVFTKLIQNIKLTGDKHIHEYSHVVLLNVIFLTLTMILKLL